MRGPTLIALASLAGGCFYPADRGRELETRVDKLTDEQKKQGEEMKAQLEELSKKSEAKVTEMNHALETLDRASRRSDADVGIQLQKAIEDVASLRGQVESYLFKINQLEQALKATQDDFQAKLDAIKTQQQKDKEHAEKELEKVKLPTTPKDYLALAEDKAKSDRVVARQLYNDFLKKWPKDELVGEAYYGLGETWYADDKCQQAMAEYGKIIQNFSKSKSAPAAYLRTSDCFKKLNMPKESELALKELVKSYPSSPEAKKAKERLESPKKKGGK